MLVGVQYRKGWGQSPQKLTMFCELALLGWTLMKGLKHLRFILWCAEGVLLRQKFNIIFIKISSHPYGGSGVRTPGPPGQLRPWTRCINLKNGNYGQYCACIEPVFRFLGGRFWFFAPRKFILLKSYHAVTEICGSSAGLNLTCRSAWSKILGYKNEHTIIKSYTLHRWGWNLAWRSRPKPALKWSVATDICDVKNTGL